LDSLTKNETLSKGILENLIKISKDHEDNEKIDNEHNKTE